MLLQRGPLGGTRIPAHDGAEGPGQPGVVVARRLAEDLLGEHPGRLHESRVVEGDERLQRRVGARSLGGTFLPARRVEQGEHRVQRRPAPEGVKTPAILLLPGGVGPAPVLVAALVEVARLVRHHARPADLLAQEAGDRQGVVPHLLGADPEPRRPVQQAVVRVGIGDRPVEGGRLPIGVRQGDLADQSLHIPTRLHEVDRQPVEQFGVGGVIALGAEIAERFDDAGAEHLGPNPVDEHPGRQRMLLRHQPPGQVEPGGLLPGQGPVSRGFQFRERGRHPPADFLALLEEIATKQDERLAGLRHLLGDQRVRDGVFGVGLQLRRRVDLLLQFVKLRLGAGVNVAQVMVADRLGVCRGALGLFDFQRGLHVAGQFGVGLRELFPSFEGSQVALVGGNRPDAGSIVIHGAVHLGEGHPADLGADGQADLLAGDLQANPFAGLGQRAHLAMVDAIGRAGQEALVLAPVGPVFPGAVVPLQHHRLRRVLGIQEDVGEQDILGRGHRQRFGRPHEKTLVQSGPMPAQRFLAGLHRGVDKRPAAFFPAALGDGVVHPDQILRFRRFDGRGLGLLVLGGRQGVGHFLLDALAGRLGGGDGFFLLGVRHFQQRRQRGAVVAAGHRFLDTGKEGEELVILLVRDRVVLVRVALGTAKRQAHPGLAEGVGAVDVVANHKLFRVGAALLVEAGVAVEPGRDFLLVGRVRQQVAGQLLDRELVKGLVGVERLDHIVPP